jgi:hypothetical protein
MSIATLILGESGTGKSYSLRNLDSKKTGLIQIIPKPLPFRSASWTPYVKDCADSIVSAMHKASTDIIVVDDFQYLMANELMRRSMEHGFQKFTDIAKNAWNILTAASALPAQKRVYLLSHTTTDETGKTKAKTIGKMLDEKITVEGLLTIVLRTAVVNGQYIFTTKNSGNDTVKSPPDMFADEHIPNDLAAVDDAICAYYGITKDQPTLKAA